MSETATSRLDIAVQRQFSELSRASAEKLIEGGFVSLNGVVIKKPAHKVKDTDKISLDYDFSEPKLPKINPEVIYEDDDVIVINKAPGLLTHSKGTFNPEATVATWLEDKYRGEKSDRAGIVHRLDRPTSGVMIVAKNDIASKWLQKQFSTRKVKKTYIAIVSGHMNLPQAIIDLPIERNPKAPQSFRVGPTGKSAVTEYSVLNFNEKASLIELKPTTGRTHQIRVHLAHLGHPIVGDTVYKGTPAERLYLHALKLELNLPSKERKVFEAQLPKEFKIYMNND